MPLDYCHPTAPHKKLRLPEWYVSSLMMDRALDAILVQELLRLVLIDALAHGDEPILGCLLYTSRCV